MSQNLAKISEGEAYVAKDNFDDGLNELLLQFLEVQIMWIYNSYNS